MAETGKNIRRLRKERHYTVSEICEYFDFEAVQTIYKWESGGSIPGIENLLTLAHLFKTPVEQILVYKTHEFSMDDMESR